MLRGRGGHGHGVVDDGTFSCFCELRKALFTETSGRRFCRRRTFWRHWCGRGLDDDVRRLLCRQIFRMMDFWVRHSEECCRWFCFRNTPKKFSRRQVFKEGLAMDFTRFIEGRDRARNKGRSLCRDAESSTPSIFLLPLWAGGEAGRQRNAVQKRRGDVFESIRHVSELLGAYKRKSVCRSDRPTSVRPGLRRARDATRRRARRSRGVRANAPGLHAGPDS